MRKRILSFLLPLLALILVVPILFRSSRPGSNQASFWLVETSTNSYLTHTSVPLTIGDEYISSDNKIYRVVKITKDKAFVTEIK